MVINRETHRCSSFTEEVCVECTAINGASVSQPHLLVPGNHFRKRDRKIERQRSGRPGEKLSSGHDRTVALVSSRHLQMTAQDLYESKAVDAPAWRS